MEQMDFVRAVAMSIFETVLINVWRLSRKIIKIVRAFFIYFYV